ncbi:MAG: carboxylate--amine ligase [Bacteroidetes bacterium]|nr:carboxylate--amine ligase [Bacteroidota bacterium]
MKSSFAILGWSLPVIESLKKADVPYVVVSFPDFEPYAKEHDIPFVSYQLDEWSDSSNSLDLVEKLKPYNADVAVPLYEETVEWAGALNSIFRDDPRVLNRAFLFRNKAMMKRKALLGGLRVGLFEEVYNMDQVHSFLDRLNEAELQLPGEEDSWFHLKPFAAAGTVGHRFIKSREDIDKKVQAGDFPCLAESHLTGKEFSCEAFIHRGKVRFLNITEYVHLGYSNFIPAGPELEAKRELILKEIQKLVDVFGIEYGMIHPEWFITEDNVLNFGEVACRIPGGHILELASQAWGFDALLAFVMCHSPHLSDEELDKYFPAKDFEPKNYFGNVMVFPQKGQITKLQIPDELLEEPYFRDHNLVAPIGNQKVGNREGFGNHFGTVNFTGESPEKMRELLKYYEEVPFYV